MSETEKCPIWGTPSTVIGATKGDRSKFNSPRAGGKYSVIGSVQIQLENLEESSKVGLTTWLVEQRQFGILCPEITSRIFDEIKKNAPLSVHERADKLLHCLDRKNDLLGHCTTFSTKADGNYSALITFYELLAWTSSLNFSEVEYLTEYCSDQNWVDYNVGGYLGDKYEIMLKPSGYTRLANLYNNDGLSMRCFVAMWFNSTMDKPYFEGIEPAIRDCGFEPIRVDKEEHSNKIDDQIIAEIRRSRFIIADFTSEPEKPRGGVYYEAGFAQGLNIPVIWTCHKDLIGEVHFDTRQFNHILWSSPEDIRKKLVARIGAVIGDGPLKS